MYFKQIICGAMVALASSAMAQNNVAEEVAWVVGDTPIWKSEIEEQLQSMRYENRDIKGDPYCFIPEQMAIQKLFLHQAELDTIEANEGQVVSRADGQINYLISELGSKEKVEQYFHKSLPELRQTYMDMIRNESRVQQVQMALTDNIKTTPSDIRRYFAQLNKDSIPYVPLQVEAQIITMEPVIPREDVEDVKARLRRYAEAVNSGESKFSALAILYSEDPGSSIRGGELGFTPRSMLDPEFAAVAFNLNDPNKVSRIVESQYGYHIIQLIEKRGDRINCRHILLTPKVSDSELALATERMDSLRNFITEGNITFDEAAMRLSMDKDTRSNRGLMVNKESGTSRFEMSQLPQEVAKNIADLQPGEISKPFVMTDSKNHTVVAMVRLANRVEGHRADLRNDYVLIKDMYEAAERERIIAEWIEKKIRETYVRVEEGYRNCDFRYKGWIREREGIANN